MPINPEIKMRNKNIFGSMISYLSKAKQNLEKDIKVKKINLNLQIKLQETIQHKVKEEVQKEYENLKEEETKMKTIKVNELNQSQIENEAKIKKVEKELNFNLQSQNIKNYSNFIMTKY